MPNVDINGQSVFFPDELGPEELNKAVSQAASQMGQKPKEFSQGFFKTYEGQPQGMAQRADVLAGKAANLGLNVLSAPFELAGEAVAAPIEQRKMTAPRLFGGEGAVDPFSYGNKLLRTGVAGATAPLRGQEMAQQAQAEYNRPQSGLDVASDITTGLGSAIVAPRVSGAPMEAATQGASRLFQGLGKMQQGIRERIVAPNARRALGKFPAGMSTEEANRVGLTALDKGVIRNPITHPFSSGREAMLERATNINESIGENIGNFLKSQGEGLDVPRAMRELDTVKAQFMNDPVIVRKVEQAKNLISKNATSLGKPDLRVALNLRGQTYVGNPGEIHVDLVNRVSRELGVSPDQLYDDVAKIGDMGFSDRGQFLTRAEASAKMGGSRPEAASLLAEGKMLGKDAKTGLPLNADGTVTLYHGTTPEGLKNINETGVLRSGGESDVYLTTDPSGAGYGTGSVAKVNVYPKDLILDDEFPGGRKDFRINVGKPKGEMKVSGIPESRESMDFLTANKLKGLFQKKVNYQSDAATQAAGKAIAGTFRGSIDTQLDELAAKLGNKGGMESFKSDKSMFGQTRKMQDVLEKQSKRDERNMPVSLPSVGIGIGGFLKKGGLEGISAALVAEWVKKYGNAVAASMINDVANAMGSAGKAAKSIGPSLKYAAPLGVAVAGSRKLTKEKAAEFLDEANGDRVKARELAKVAGYSWKKTSSTK